jgi:hypothetical protein
MTDGNRPVRTRMPGGVGGAGSIPAPTRFGLGYLCQMALQTILSCSKTFRKRRSRPRQM